MCVRLLQSVIRRFNRLPMRTIFSFNNLCYESGKPTAIFGIVHGAFSQATNTMIDQGDRPVVTLKRRERENIGHSPGNPQFNWL